MAVNYCQMCIENPGEQSRYGDRGLGQGEVCPVCYNPTCRHHLGTVRWRWRKSGELDAALICKDCLRAYKHRDWDKFNRDWIT